MQAKRRTSTSIAAIGRCWPAAHHRRARRRGRSPTRSSPGDALGDRSGQRHHDRFARRLERSSERLPRDRRRPRSPVPAAPRSDDAATATTTTTTAPASWLGSIPSPWGDLYLDAGGGRSAGTRCASRRSAEYGVDLYPGGPALRLPDLRAAGRALRACTSPGAAPRPTRPATPRTSSASPSTSHAEMRDVDRSDRLAVRLGQARGARTSGGTSPTGG